MDAARVETFADRMAGVLDNASLALLISVGYRTGLFEVMAGAPPATSEEVARDAGLHERYVREWLGGMVVGEIVQYDPLAGTYALPAEHAAVLTKAAGPDDVGIYMQYVSLMGSVEPEIARVFGEGGGLPYEAYAEFQTLQRDDTARVFDAGLVATILPVVPGIIERLEAGIDALDVGTGAGHAVNVMAKAFPASRFRGIDLSAEGIELARAEARAWGLPNAKFDVADASDIDGRFDLVTAFDCIHDQARPRDVLASIAASLNHDGVFLMGDFAFSSRLEENIGRPLAATIFAFSVFHCLTVSLAYGGEGLGTAWGEQLARQLLTEAGFAHVDTTLVDGDPLNLYFVARVSRA